MQSRPTSSWAQRVPADALPADEARRRRSDWLASLLPCVLRERVSKSRLQHRPAAQGLSPLDPARARPDLHHTTRPAVSLEPKQRRGDPRISDSAKRDFFRAMPPHGHPRQSRLSRLSDRVAYPRLRRSTADYQSNRGLSGWSQGHSAVSAVTIIGATTGTFVRRADGHDYGLNPPIVIAMARLTTPFASPIPM